MKSLPIADQFDLFNIVFFSPFEQMDVVQVIRRLRRSISLSDSYDVEILL